MLFKLFSLSLIFFLFSSCSPYKFFYHPNNVLYIDPAKLNYPHEMKWYESKNGKELFGLFFPTAQKSKGLVIHFHGNFGNVSNHFPLSYFLTEFGYDVFIFDYQGYGGSKGSPSPKKLIEDGIATLKFAQTLKKQEAPLFVFGHSLGGAVALATLAKNQVPVQAAVIQSSFTGYRAIARDVLSRFWAGWILYPIYPWFLSKKYDPIKAIPKISDVPLLFVHGSEDKVIPSKMSLKLYEKAGEPKSYYLVQGAGHNNIRDKGGDDYKKTLVSFFDSHLN